MASTEEPFDQDDHPDRDLTQTGEGGTVYVLYTKGVVVGCYSTVRGAEHWQKMFGGWVEAVQADSPPNFAKV